MYCFFFSKIIEFNRQYDGIFREYDEEDEEDGEGQDSESKDGGINGEIEENSQVIWLDILDTVSETTRFNYEQCWQLPIHEFFMYYNYARIKNERRRKLIDRQNNIRRY